MSAVLRLDPPELRNEEYELQCKAEQYAANAADSKRAELMAGMSAQDVMDVLEMASDEEVKALGVVLLGNKIFRKAIDELVGVVYDEAHHEFMKAYKGNPSLGFALKACR